MKNPVSPNTPTAPAGPSSQVCAKCGAVFRWEPRDPAIKGGPLTAHLIKSSEQCDCGYGSLAPVFED